MDDIKCFSIPIQPMCLLRCSFCPNSDEFQANTPQATSSEIIEYIQFAESWGITEISLYTEIGEVLLCQPKKLSEVLIYCENSNIIENVYLFTSLTKINKKTLNVAIDNKYKKVSIIVSVYGMKGDDMIDRTGVDCFDDFMLNYDVVKNVNKVSYLNRSQKPNTMGIDFIEETPTDINYNTKIYTKEKNLITTRNGICKYAIKEDCGFNTKGYLVQCGWFVVDKVVGHISEGADVLEEKLNIILKNQKFNIFDVKCSNCNGYESLI